MVLSKKLIFYFSKGLDFSVDCYLMSGFRQSSFNIKKYVIIHILNDSTILTMMTRPEHEPILIDVDRCAFW